MGTPPTLLYIYIKSTYWDFDLMQDFWSRVTRKTYLSQYVIWIQVTLY